MGLVFCFVCLCFSASLSVFAFHSLYYNLSLSIFPLYLFTFFFLFFFFFFFFFSFSFSFFSHILNFTSKPIPHFLPAFSPGRSRGYHAFSLDARTTVFGHPQRDAGIRHLQPHALREATHRRRARCGLAP